MKKYMSIIAVVSLSTMLLAGCENMSASEQRIGTAALGGAVGGAAGNSLGGGVGAAIGGGAGAAVGSKAQGGSNRSATYSGVGVRLVQPWVKACLVVIPAQPLVVPSAVAQAQQLKNVNNVLSSNFQKKALHGSAFFIAVPV